jgi:hypothetical protein
MTCERAALPQELEPREWEKLVLPSGAELAVGITRPTFQLWQGDAIGNTFGGKPLIDTGGVAEFAELAILRTFERGGWNGRWLETYGAKTSAPYSFTRWEDCRLSEQPQEPVDDPGAQRLLDEIAVLAGGFGGCWDVFAWKDETYVFAEGKHSKKDSIRDTQTRWLEAALACGCDESNFLVVEWTFSAA